MTEIKSKFNSNLKESINLLNNTNDIFYISNQMVNIYRKSKVSYRLKSKFPIKFILKRIINTKVKKYKFSKDIKYLFITHLINKDQLKSLNDNYLDKMLTSSKKKIKFSRFFINHLNNENIQIKRDKFITDYIIDFKIFLLNDFFIIFNYVLKYLNFKLFNKNNFLDQRITINSTLQAVSHYKLANKIISLIQKKLC